MRCDSTFRSIGAFLFLIAILVSNVSCQAGDSDGWNDQPEETITITKLRTRYVCPCTETLPWHSWTEPGRASSNRTERSTLSSTSVKTGSPATTQSQGTSTTKFGSAYSTSTSWSTSTSYSTSIDFSTSLTYSTSYGVSTSSSFSTLSSFSTSSSLSHTTTSSTSTSVSTSDSYITSSSGVTTTDFSTFSSSSGSFSSSTSFSSSGPSGSTSYSYSISSSSSTLSSTLSTTSRSSTTTAQQSSSTSITSTLTSTSSSITSFSTSSVSTTSSSSSTTTTSAALEYEYIVVGSGAGGGVLAARLAENGHKVLLIEAGDDQTGNANTSVPGYQAAVTQDPKIRWDMFVNHYQDFERAKLDPKYVYTIGDGEEYVGLDPPVGATPKGILYPRAATLGGCVTHNALIYIEPQASDWNNIADITGDNSWQYSNMLQYYDKVDEWQPVAPTDPTILLRDTMLARHLAGGAAVEGVQLPVVDTITGLGNALLNNPNNRLPGRDSTQGFFQIPLIQRNGERVSVRDRILEVAQSSPLTIRQNCFVTNLVFDKTNKTTVIGVDFLDGAYLYDASPSYDSSQTGTPGRAVATKEVILAGGAFNTPQILKLSGIGPADELRKFDIPVVIDLPGVGTNMQDRYEIPVNVVHPNDFPILDGCTFDMKPHDLCYQQWLNNPSVLAQRGAYATDGLAAMMIVRSQTADNSDFDLNIFGGPVNFTGYFPWWGDAAVASHKVFSWYALKGHTRNRAGTVMLSSADPRKQPQIDFNYFDTGTTTNGADEKDLDAIVEAIKLARKALENYDEIPANVLPGTDFVEQRPGADIQSDNDLKTFIKTQAWGHHASCTCPIGADNDPMAVLDSQFRVRGAQNLRVVDASVFPLIPGTFIQSPIFIMAEKAAAVIMANNQ